MATDKNAFMLSFFAIFAKTLSYAKIKDDSYHKMKFKK